MAMKWQTILLCIAMLSCSVADDIRLRGGTSAEGRVEVYLRGEWGCVCDDHFDSLDAKVVCRMLGFSSGVPLTRRISGGPSRIWLDDVECSGAESSIYGCPHAGIGVHNCRSWERVVVRCTVSVPGRAVDGMWSDWFPWSNCGKTCGGGLQTRMRTCTDPAPKLGGSYCVGNSNESRSCADWLCPNCSQPCIGMLSACSLCMCRDTILNGRVVDMNTRIPLPEVRVHVVSREWDVAAITGNHGEFRLTGLCLDGLQLKFKRDGYISPYKKYSLSRNPPYLGFIRMQKLVAPVFTLHPNDEARFIGSSVTFRCSAHAVPAPHLYEWFKDGKVISGGSTTPTTPNTFTIQSVTASNAGKYACRAASLSGKTFSRDARLIVASARTRDTCDRSPRRFTQRLPVSCHALVNGERVTEIDIGRCSGVACITKVNTQVGGRCCGPVRYIPIDVECLAHRNATQFSRVLACGCIPCNEGRDVIIIGHVFIMVGDTKQTSSQIAVLDIGGTSTLVSLHNRGAFILMTVATANTISIFVHPMLKPGDFFSKVEIIPVTAGSMVIHHDIILERLPSPTNLNATEDATIRIPSSDGLSSSTTVNIPANSLVDENGNLATGNVNAYSKFHHPKQLLSTRSIPGEFSTIDEDGFLRPLQTFGVMALDFKDNAGNRLKLTRPVKLRVNTSALNIPIKSGQPDAKVWNMDKSSGRWKDQGNLSFSAKRKKRYILQWANGVIDTNEVPYGNYDKPWIRERLCEALVFVYSEQPYTAAPGIPVESIVVSDDGSSLLGRLSTTTDQEGRACVLVACGLKNYIYVPDLPSGKGTLGVHFLPQGFTFEDQDSIFVFFEASPISAPIFAGYNGECHQKTYDIHHFVFIYNGLKPQGLLYPKENIPNKPLSWYQNNAASEPDNTTACFIKVGIVARPSDVPEIQFTATSRMASHRGPLYGFYINGVWPENVYTQPGYNYISCLQVKCSSYATTTSSRPPRAITTHVDVALFHPNASLCSKRDNSYGSTVKSTTWETDLLPQQQHKLGLATGSRAKAHMLALYSCLHNKKAIVGFDCTDIRLRGGTSAEGRVEVYLSGEWGCVCDDHFDSIDATVVCRMLGFSSGVPLTRRISGGPSRIWLDDVKCRGTDSSIYDCPHAGIGVHNCDSSERVVVRCTGYLSG